MKSEYSIASALCTWVGYNKTRYPELRLFFHIANEGRRAAWVSHRIGIVSGIPDYCLPVARGGYHSLWIELKAPGKKRTEKQQDIADYLTCEGHSVHVCDSVMDAVDVIEHYLLS